MHGLFLQTASGSCADAGPFENRFEIPGEFVDSHFGDKLANPSEFCIEHRDKVFAFDEIDSRHTLGYSGQRTAEYGDLLFEVMTALFETRNGICRREVNEETHRRHEFRRFAPGNCDDLAECANKFFATGGRNGVGSAFWTSAITAGVFREDEPGTHEASDGVIERAPFQCENFVLVAFTEQALHLVGVHGSFAQEGEDGNFPNSEVFAHIARMSYIV
jgi:hypothetical protein